PHNIRHEFRQKNWIVSGSQHATHRCLAFTRHYSGREKKRFYKNVSITQSGSKAFEINLDQRKLKTPSGQPLVIPTESLAVAVATEWDTQHEFIKQHSMHLTALCNTVLDNPTHRTKAQIIRAMLHFLETDTICYRLEDPPELVAMQDEKWEPMLDWINKKYEVDINSTTSITGPVIPQETYRNLEHHLETHSDWALVGYENAIECLKSLVLTFALMDREITVEEAASLSRLETEFQIDKWGSVEWAHDTEFADTKSRVAAAVLFTHLVTEHTEIIQKSRTQ
ncbi:ATP synthase mitochondrial F1 complex assembly factor 2, partial [Strongylocentrotus purpuratus]|uniref:ATP synthase mitochondrial F1 complex assembly factor 2 n=1 Tax=Strongylocentrotus purpuratus TaxID=7668 RepID=A0A7M7NSY4_STRPU